MFEHARKPRDEISSYISLLLHHASPKVYYIFLSKQSCGSFACTDLKREGNAQTHRKCKQHTLSLQHAHTRAHTHTHVNVTTTQSNMLPLADLSAVVSSHCSLDVLGQQFAKFLQWCVRKCILFICFESVPQTISLILPHFLHPASKGTSQTCLSSRSHPSVLAKIQNAAQKCRCHVPQSIAKR